MSAASGSRAASPQAAPLPVTLIVVSDRAARGERADETAAAMAPVLAERGFVLASTVVVADEQAEIEGALRQAAAAHRLVLTTGGTGVGPRDVTPEATARVLDLPVPGLAEEMRRRSVEATIHAVGSRALAGFAGQALILNLPGRPRGAVACFVFVAPALRHLIQVRGGPVADATHGAADAP